jgi:hypothetical protein
MSHEPVTATLIDVHVVDVQTYALTVPVQALPVMLAVSQWLSLSQLVNVAGVVDWSHFQGPAPLMRHPLVPLATSFPPAHVMAGGDGVAESAADVEDVAAAARTRLMVTTTLRTFEMRI